MDQVAFLVGPVGLYKQGQGVLTQAVLHVVVQVGLLHAGEWTLEAFVVVRLSEWTWDVVRLFGLPLFVLLTARSHLTLLLRHGGGRNTRRKRGMENTECTCLIVCVSGFAWFQNQCGFSVFCPT